jgi:hypothetical protein
MGWTIATYIERAVLIVLLPIMLFVVYHLIKQELVEIKSDIKRAFNQDKKCLFCERVSIEVWACHSDQGYCINCCYCPDHKDTIHRHNTCKTAPANTWCGLCAEIN